MCKNVKLHFFKVRIQSHRLFSAITLAVSFLCHTVNAQQYVPEVFPPSPVASDLAKFVDNPISLYTGSPNVTIPIFNTRQDGVSLDIKLAYNSRGAQVAEIASSTGQGWTLFSGGVITRQMRDKPDEFSRGYLKFNYIEGFQSDISKRNIIFETGQAENSADIEPDIFYFNFLGRTGKFIFDQMTKKPVLQTTEDIDLQVEFQSSTDYTITRFILKDEQGNTYYFGKNKAGSAMAYDRLNGSSSGDITAPLQSSYVGAYTTGWYLTEIESKNNRHVYFNYDQESITTYTKSDGKTNNGDLITFLTKNITVQNRIKEITFDSGKINFIKKSTAREDLENSYLIEKINVTNNIGESIIIADLSYSLTTGNNSNIHPTLLSADPGANKRYLLTSIKVNAENYQFFYNPTALPNRHSNSIDYWGYYNGATNPVHMLAGSANRNVNGQYAKAGMLESIIYPHGGETQFEYENNTVLAPPFFQSFLIPSAGGSETEEVVHLVRILDTQVVEYPFTISSRGTDQNIYYKSSSTCLTDDCSKYQIELLRADGSRVMFLYPVPGEYLKILQPIPDGNYKIRITNFGTIDPDLPFMYVLYIMYKKVSTPSNPNVGIPFTGGGQRIKAIISDSKGNGKILKEYSYTKGSALSGRLFSIPDYFYVARTVGNVAVTSGNYSGYSRALSPLSNYNDGGSVGYSVVIETQKEFGTNVKLGHTVTEFVNYLDGGKYYVPPYNVKDDYSWIRGQVINENTFDRDSVLVKKISHIYHYYGDKNQPYLQYRDNQGLIKSNQNITTGDVIPPDESDPATIKPHYYISKRLSRIPIYKAGVYSSSGWTAPVDYNAYRVSFFIGGSMLKKTIEVYELRKDGAINVKTDYSYSGSQHIQPTQVSVASSDGSNETILTTYPEDYASGTAFIDNMKTNHLIAYPIEQVKYREVGTTRTILSGAITKYLTGGKGLIDQTLELESSQPIALSSFKFSNRAAGQLPVGGTPTTFAPHSGYQARLTYGNTYDAFGNPQQVTPIARPSTTYIWSYKGQYPVAEIRNATLVQVQTAFGGSATLTSFTASNPTDAVVKSKLDPLRAALPNAAVSWYTYKPLVGMTSATDPSGRTTYYYYDGFGRLKETKDTQSKTTGTYEYHYRQ